jgi:hypothetical protein
VGNKSVSTQRCYYVRSFVCVWMNVVLCVDEHLPPPCPQALPLSLSMLLVCSYPASPSLLAWGRGEHLHPLSSAPPILPLSLPGFCDFYCSLLFWSPLRGLRAVRREVGRKAGRGEGWAHRKRRRRRRSDTVIENRVLEQAKRWGEFGLKGERGMGCMYLERVLICLQVLEGRVWV